MKESDLISRTVYSFRYPETTQLIKELYSGTEIYERHEDACSKKQDQYHKDFEQAYRTWVKPIVQLDRESPSTLEGYDYFYPSSGSSEAIREVIARMGSGYRNPRVHVFEGEYEGYKAYAEAHDVEVVEHTRENYKNTLFNFHEMGTLFGDVFFISQPSGIDGNVWNGYDDFVSFIEYETPDLKIAVDLAYVGACALEYKIDVSSSAIQCVFVSLSKSFGVYYNRIGGVFSREAIDGLYGNQWFKNIDSLYIGEKLMDRYTVHALPRKYATLSGLAASKVQSALGIPLSDYHYCHIILLGLVKDYSEHTFEGEYRRTLKTNVGRICLTPILSALAKEPL